MAKDSTAQRILGYAGDIASGGVSKLVGRAAKNAPALARSKTARDIAGYAGDVASGGVRRLVERSLPRSKATRKAGRKMASPRS